MTPQNILSAVVSESSSFGNRPECLIKLNCLSDVQNAVGQAWDGFFYSYHRADREIEGLNVMYLVILDNKF